jgi:hypothetical protein
VLIGWKVAHRVAEAWASTPEPGVEPDKPSHKGILAEVIHLQLVRKEARKVGTVLGVEREPIWAAGLPKACKFEIITCTSYQTIWDDNEVGLLRPWDAADRLQNIYLGRFWCRGIIGPQYKE